MQVASNIEQQFQKIGDSFVSAGKKLTTRVTAPLVALGGLSVKAFDTQIQAEKRLEAQLKATGEEVQGTMADFKEFASGLQEITTVGDESTLQMIQVAKSMGLTNDQAKRAAKNSIALAKAMGMNEQSAIRYAAALEQGQVTMLSRYLPGLREIEDMSERAAKAQELLSDMFGAATAEAQNGLGPMKQIKNTLGDFSEVVGDIVLTKMQPLIDNLKSTADWLKGLDRQSQETIVGVGGLAAAIGPATLGLGWAIKLTIPAVKTLSKVVRGLTATMMANPYLAVGAAIAAIGVKSYFTNKRLQELHDSISDILDTNIGELGLEQVNKKIADTANRIKEIEDGMVGAAVSSNKEWQRLNKQLDRLVDLRNEIASKELWGKIINDRLQNTQQLLNFINTEFTGIINTANANPQAIAKPFIEAKQPIDDIIPALDMMTQGFQELTAAQILADEGITNLPPKMSLVTEKTKEAAGAGRQFGQALGQAMSQAVLHAKRFDDVLKNILKQLASQALMQFVTAVITGGSSLAAGSIGKTLFGGMFHKGGVVPGSGEKMALVKGGEGIFTQGQMKALGGMQNGGGTKKLELHITGDLQGDGSTLRGVINESQFIDLN